MWIFQKNTVLPKTAHLSTESWAAWCPGYRNNNKNGMQSPCRMHLSHSLPPLTQMAHEWHCLPPPPPRPASLPTLPRCFTASQGWSRCSFEFISFIKSVHLWMHLPLPKISTHMRASPWLLHGLFFLGEGRGFGFGHFRNVTWSCSSWLYCKQTEPICSSSDGPPQCLLLEHC
jgi:hypothetical protein